MKQKQAKAATRAYYLVASILLVVLGTIVPPCIAADLQLEGFQYIKAGNFNKALNCFNAALKEKPNSWVILQNVANCQMELGHCEQAMATLQKSIEIGGLHSTQCNNMAAVFQRMGDAKRALNWLSLACKLDPPMRDNVQVMAAISKLQDPENNPSGSPATPDYLSSLSRAKGWTKAAMPIKVYVRPNQQLPSFYPAFQSSIRDAFDQWRTATGDAFSYKFVDSSDAADLVCDYTDRKELISSQHELGIDGTAEMLIKMDQSPGKGTLCVLVKDGPGASAFRSRELVTRCCLHEVGHALGMGGHSPNMHDIMFPGALRNDQDKLSERDKETMRKIYAAGGKQISAR